MKTEWVYGMAKFNVSVDTLGSGRYRGGGQRGPRPTPSEIFAAPPVAPKKVQDKAVTCQNF